ncbi:MAG: DUF2254 domain-containing protein, partial [Acidobacteriota bacterium]
PAMTTTEPQPSGRRRGPPRDAWRFARVSARRTWDTYWFVPGVAVLAALALAVWLTRWDQVDPIELRRPISPSSASAALAALGSGMLAFTGFVTSVVLMVVQFGSTAFSPRLVGAFRQNRTLKYSLSTFSATFLFALVSTALIGIGGAEAAPTRTLVAALLLTLASLLMFLVLVNSTSNGLRVAEVVQTVDRLARDAFDATYPSTASDAAAAQETANALAGQTPRQTILHRRVGSVIMGIDRTGLCALARRHGALFELIPAIGDHVPPGATLIRVHSSREVSERRLLHYIALGSERTIDEDPAFSIRLLVDVAIKALSPSINDPTTAVQSLDRIEDLLRHAAPKHLSVGAVTDTDGVVRLVYPTPTWDDLVELALDEIRAFGAGQYQVTRRMLAMLDDLIADVPSRRVPALVRQRELLVDAVTNTIAESQRADALVPDRQGLGMARRTITPSG